MSGAPYIALTPWELSKLDAMGYACFYGLLTVLSASDFVELQTSCKTSCKTCNSVIDHRRKALTQASLRMPTKGPQTAAIMVHGSMQMTTSRYRSVVQL